MKITNEELLLALIRCREIIFAFKEGFLHLDKDNNSDKLKNFIDVIDQTIDAAQANKDSEDL